MATSKPSVESVVFRKLYAKLKDGIQSDLDAFAVDLYSQELITKETRDSATNHEVSSGRRAITLFNAIEEKIMISGSVFWKFLEILEVYRKNLATELREEFEKFKNKPEQCDGVSEDPDLSVPIDPVQERKEASSSYVPSITVSNGTALTGQCIPQPATALTGQCIPQPYISSHRDLKEQVPLRESGKSSALFIDSVGVKSWSAQLGESDGNEESRIVSYTDAVTDTVAAHAAVRERVHVVNASEVQGNYHRSHTKMKQEYAKTGEYYKQQLERRDQECNELERELELTRKELEQCKTVHKKETERELELTRKELEQCKVVHKKETEHLKGQIESGEEERLCMLRQCTEQDRKLRQKDSELQEQDRVLQEKDSELQEQDRKLREKDTKLQGMKKELVDRDAKLHLHEKETEHLKGQIESGEKDVLYIVRESRLKHSERNQTLTEKDTELQEMKQKLVDQDAKLMEKDDHLHRMEAELNEMKAQLQQKEMELQEKKQENNLLQGRLEQEVIKRKLYMCKRIYELVDQMSKERNVQELQEIRERINRKILELRVSVVRRKSLSWCGVMYSQDHYFRS